MRYNAMFFVCDENRNQISDKMLGEINVFTNYRDAAAAAKKLSKKVSSLFMIDVCVPCVIFENGKEKQDY